VQVRLIDPDDERALAECAAVLEASDKHLWPELSGFKVADLRAFTRFRGKSRRWELLAAGEPGAPVLGMALMEFPMLENPHSAEIILAVHPEHRRRGVGTALVERMCERARDDSRRTLNTIVDVPVGSAGGEGGEGVREFATSVGFETTLTGNLRHLHVPLEQDLLDHLRQVVADARDAADYRVHTLATPWPAEYLDDVCTLLGVMSTDEPAGDGERQAEHWDEERVREDEGLLVSRRVGRLAAVAEHVPSGHLVAMTELCVADDSPRQSWQMITVVHPDHRGHRLGLAIKLANLDLLARQAPAVQLVQTGNAAVNAPMIGVNEMMGFEVASEGAFWQKHLTAPAT
jgi:GNAT superfamily N-acetyltransferase